MQNVGADPMATNTLVVTASKNDDVCTAGKNVGTDERARMQNVGADPMATNTLVVTAGKNDDVWTAGKNVAKLEINHADAISIYDVLRADKIVVEEAAFDTLNARFQ